MRGDVTGALRVVHGSYGVQPLRAAAAPALVTQQDTQIVAEQGLAHLQSSMEPALYIGEAAAAHNR